MQENVLQQVKLPCIAAYFYILYVDILSIYPLTNLTPKTLPCSFEQGFFRFSTTSDIRKL